MCSVLAAALYLGVSCSCWGVGILLYDVYSFCCYANYLIVMGEIHSAPVALVSIYGPDFYHPTFFRKVFPLITDISQTNLIVGGDLNCTLDP